MFRKTLALDLERKASRNVILNISIPQGIPIKLKNVPQFYSNDFLSLNYRKGIIIFIFISQSFGIQ